MTNQREEWIGTLILGVFALFALLPLVGIVITALQVEDGSAPSFGSLHGIDFGNFSRAWDEANFGQYLKSSAFVAIVVVVGSSIFSILAGYAFALMRFRGSQALFYLLLLGLMIPTEAIIVPLYYDFVDLNVIGTYWSVILPQVGTSVAFGTFWMRAYFRSVPRSLTEAARIDGASSFYTLWRVILPLARPAVLTMVVLIFMWTWNEFLLALVMIGDDESLKTAPLGLSNFIGRNTQDLTLLAAGSVIVALPIIVVYAFLQRHFIRGMVTGAVKG